jgi:hypothetical protein
MQNMEDEGSSMWVIDGTSEVYDSAIRHEGTRSIRITATTSTAAVPIQSKLKWYDNTKKYTLHSWIKTQNAAEVNVSIQYFSSRTAYNPVSTEDLLSTALNGRNDWTFCQREITIPENCLYYLIVCTVGNGMAWFDEVGLIEWTPWQDVSLLQAIPTPNDYYWMQIKSMANPKSLRVSYSEAAYQLAAPVSLRSGYVPLVSRLLNYPNPCNPETTISFYLSDASQVNLSIYNVKGQKVKQLHDGMLSIGKQTFHWNGRDNAEHQVGSGLYFYRVDTEHSTALRKVILLK